MINQLCCDSEQKMFFIQRYFDICLDFLIITL